MAHHRLGFAAIAVILFSTSLGLIVQCAEQSHWAVTSGLVAVVMLCLLFAAFSTYLALAPTSSLHIQFTAVKHVLTKMAMWFIGWRTYRTFQAATTRVRIEQEKFLRRFLSENSNTAYGKIAGYSEILKASKPLLDEFRQRHPLTSYDTYGTFIEQVEKGQHEDVLTEDAVVRFGVSSGTTRKSKLLPINSAPKRALKLYLACRYAVNRAHGNWLNSLLHPLKITYLTFTPNWRYSAGGLPIGPVSGWPIDQEPWFLDSIVTTPKEVRSVHLGERAEAYLRWLFALADPDMYLFQGTFAGVVLSFFEFLRENWIYLASDLQNNQISWKEFNIPESLAIKLEAKLPSNNTQRANEIIAECSKGFDGIVKRLWPRMEMTICAVTGSHGVHAERVQWFLGDKIQIVCPFYDATEGFFGVNVDPTANYFYQLLPTETFQEFIPLERTADKQPPTVLLDELEVGKTYELVVTSPIGICRYRMGDLVEIAGFHNQTPIVDFIARVGSLLDLRGERTPENLVTAALTEATAYWDQSLSDCAKSKKLRLIDYSATESSSLAKALGQFDSTNGKQFYVIFAEIDGLERALTEKDVKVFDEALIGLHQGYKSFRSQSNSSAPKIFAVQPGTFECLMRQALERNQAVSNQYKTPRYVKANDAIQLLLEQAFTSRVPNRECCT